MYDDIQSEGTLSFNWATGEIIIKATFLKDKRFSRQLQKAIVKAWKEACQKVREEYGSLV